MASASKAATWAENVISMAGPGAGEPERAAAAAQISLEIRKKHVAEDAEAFVVCTEMSWTYFESDLFSAWQGHFESVALPLVKPRVCEKEVESANLPNLGAGLA